MYIKQLYLSLRFYLIATLLFALFCFAFFFKWLFWPALVLLIAFGMLFLLDTIFLFFLKKPISVERNMAPLLSLGDKNEIKLRVTNKIPFPVNALIIEELPYQFQKRDFRLYVSLKGMEIKETNYKIMPKRRGEYAFGFCNIFLSTPVNFVRRRYKGAQEEVIPVYPSIIQMKQFQLYTFQKLAKFYGLKKMRRIGHSYEFEQIKEYVRGDDVRSINWKATGRKGELMVNHYQEEKSQPVYCLIDKSRNMLMPFGGLSLMDYAINSTLVISNVALQKGDKSGLLTFSDKIGSAIKADSGPKQLRKILEALYKQKERETESDYNLLLFSIKKMIPSRSLLFLYMNFESHYALQRVLPILRRINKSHLLVVIFFENDEISNFAQSETGISIDHIIMSTIAEEFIMDKLKIKQDLANYGIQCILTKPKDLTINTLNKYLELKARGMI